MIASLVATHRFIFLPLEQGRLFHELGSVDFWSEQRQSGPDRRLVVIIEDAEEFLLERVATHGNSRVADLLNIGDGLKGDYLQLHLICTINCPLQALDKAIARPGRLLGYRRFNRLTPEQADYSLAEIYNGLSVLTETENPKFLGFAA